MSTFFTDFGLPIETPSGSDLLPEDWTGHSYRVQATAEEISTIAEAATTVAGLLPTDWIDFDVRDPEGRLAPNK